MNISQRFSLVRVNPTGMFTDKYDSYAWIQACDYKTIFGDKRKMKMAGKKKYVQISDLSGENKIYRIIETAGYKGITKSAVGLSYNSIADLGLNPNNLTDAKVEINPIHPFKFILNNPDQAQKCTVWLSLVTFILGVFLGAILDVIIKQF